MKILAIISQKGGVGKTTLATALAVVFDLDPQASAVFWKDTRQDEAPAVIAIPPSACAEGGGFKLRLKEARAQRNAEAALARA